jgi:hypothetical protein
MTASNQWASRPADQRFTSLTLLDEFMARRRSHSRAAVVSSRSITAMPDPADNLKGLQFLGRKGNAITPTNWSFGQAAQLAGAPAGYLRDLPAPLAADCINYGLHVKRDVEDVGLLIECDDAGLPKVLSAATGPSYGRIWNADITKELVRRFGAGDGTDGGSWKVPGEFGKAVTVTNANTTIYGSDRDMFVFLADEQNRLEIPNRRGGKSGSLARGFFTWNSEVGAATFGIAFFLFDFVCCNRIVWGAQQYMEKRVRHTMSAPDKWLDGMVPLLTAYAKAPVAPMEAAIQSAQQKKIDDVQAFLANRFTKSQAFAIAKTHEDEEGRPIETLWDAATGITAYARNIEFQDQRVGFEREAGKVLDLVAA